MVGRRIRAKENAGHYMDGSVVDASVRASLGLRLDL